MEMSEIIKQAEENIRQAIEDYRRHTHQTEVLDNISNAFIKRLAEDSSRAKQELRELFSQSPVWDSKLDALVINGTRTHSPDYTRIADLARKIFQPAYCRDENTSYEMLEKVVRFFSMPDSQDAQQEGIAAIAQIAPKAYAQGRKLSRVFKAICVHLGIADETAGSEFQKLYAQFADELTAKKIGFKLYVSINPAHFLTVSNPKCDERGNTLTSCHSFNSTKYEYNNGCTGYARDKYSFIVFTVNDPMDAETLNNRKTTRQIFAYKPGNGLLMQSRFYNTSGGVYGAAEDSKLYRDLVQREISALERVPNLWKTYPYCGKEKEHCVQIGSGFGGYVDWTYDNFDGKVSIRADHEEDYEPLTVGTWGICVVCAEETSHGVYCKDCDDDHDDREYCDDCEEYYDSDDMYTVYDRRGNEIRVCQNCLDDHYTRCDCCDEYHHSDNVTWVEDVGQDYCDDCLAEYCEQCDECGEWHLRENMFHAIDHRGNEVWICEDCIDEYICCEECGCYVHPDYAVEAFNEDGAATMVCPDCRDRYYSECEDCGRYFKNDVMQDGRCPDCYQETEDGEEEAV